MKRRSSSASRSASICLVSPSRERSNAARSAFSRDMLLGGGGGGDGGGGGGCGGGGGGVVVAAAAVVVIVVVVDMGVVVVAEWVAPPTHPKRTGPLAPAPR